MSFLDRTGSENEAVRAFTSAAAFADFASLVHPGPSPVGRVLTSLSDVVPPPAPKKVVRRG